MWQELKNIYHLIRAVIANLYFGFPAKGMTIIGVTGTDGKTTTSHLLYHILSESGKKTALISTIAAIIGGKHYDTGFHVSTPDSFQLQSYLKKAKEAGTEYLVLEVTSHGLDQNRVFGVPFSVGVLTNITHEHLDYHKTFARYVKAKAKLLQAARIAVINRDDASYKKVLPYITDKTVITYGLKQSSDINPLTFSFKTKLLGEYNRYNSLAAIATTQALGIDDHLIQKAVGSFSLPKGRLEVVQETPFKVIIDFAHTPNSIEQVLKAVKKETDQQGKLIHIFGSAGLRDPSKRPEMGKMSAKYADHIILTSEDPRSESPEKIIEEIISGMKNLSVPIEKNPDRQEAITQGITLAKKGDTVLITGKGHEQSMNFGKGEMPWSDTDAVTKALQQLHDKK